MTQGSVDTDNDTIRILHVDDTPGVRDETGTHLSGQNERFTIDTRATTAEGLNYLSDHQVDCIIAEYELPDRTGIALLKAVRRDYPDLPFILYTDVGSEEVASDAISAGVSDYLQKDTGTDHYTILANRITNLVAQARAETKAERTQTYYSRILEHASDYVMIVSEAGAVQYVSPSVERVMGYTPDDLSGADAFETIHPDDFSIAAEAFIDLLDNPTEERVVEYRACHADGSWRWLEVRGRNLLDDPVIDGLLVTVRDITERKEHEEELTTVQRRFDAVLENTTTPMFLKADDGSYIFVNREYRDLFGFDDEDVIGRTDEDLHPPEVAAVVQRNDQTVVKHGEPIETEEEVLVDGETRVFLATKVPIYDTGERSDPDDPVGVFGVATDITERKRQTRRLDTLISNLPGIVYRSRNDPDWPMEVVRGECESLTGYSAAALLAGDVIWGDDLLHPDDEARIWAEVQDAVENNRAFEVTYRIQTKDGSIKWMWERGRVIDSTSTEAEILEGFITDITAQKEREESLRRFREAVEQAGTAVFITDTDGVIQFVNEEFEALTGYESEAAVGETPGILSPDSHEESPYEELWTTIQAGDVWEDTVVGQRRSGEQYTAVQTVAPITDEDERITGFVCVQNEITDRLVEQQRLSVLNRMLRHNLRNELTVVMGKAETMMELHTDEQTRSAMATVIERCQQLLRESKKAQEFQQLLNQDRHDDRSVESILGTLREAAASFSSGELEIVSDDVGQAMILDVVEVALVELVENAFIHGSGDGRVQVSVERPEERQVAFVVADEGPGLPEMEQRVLDGEVEQPLNHSQGFGLWMAYWLVQLAGGSITHEQQEPSGTTVRVQVPVTTEGAEAA